MISLPTSQSRVLAPAAEAKGTGADQVPLTNSLTTWVSPGRCRAWRLVLPSARTRTEKAGLVLTSHSKVLSPAPPSGSVTIHPTG